MKEAVEEQNIEALAIIQPQDIQTVFTNSGELQPLLDKIAALARATKVDVNTPAGRKEIASVAF